MVIAKILILKFLNSSGKLSRENALQSITSDDILTRLIMYLKNSYVFLQQILHVSGKSSVRTGLA